MSDFLEESIYYQLDKGDFVGDGPELYTEFKYGLDHFQNFGCKAINDNENILVTAHTGAGKTALAIHAISRWLSISNSQIIYCSPI